MRYLIVLSAFVAALASVGNAAGGGWATVGFAPLPDGTAVGETWKPEITVLQHGQTPLGGLTPVVRISGDGDTRSFTASETSEVGVYEADVVFPSSGEWRIVIESGFGESNVTYGPVTIGPGLAGAPSSFPLAPVLAVLGACALVAAAAFGVVRQRRLTPAS
jgi:hypothetical protein